MMEDDQVILWVKAGFDDLRLGGDQLCQQIFMYLVEKSLAEESRLK